MEPEGAVGLPASQKTAIETGPCIYVLFLLLLLSCSPIHAIVSEVDFFLKVLDQHFVCIS
jgi:hypothetical protein